MPRSAACASVSTTGMTTSAGGSWSLYSLVRTSPPPYHGKPKFWPAAVMRLISPGGMSSPMPSTWLSVNQSSPVSGWKSWPTELRMPAA